MFFLKSLVLSVFSPSFYREAVAKGTGKALGVIFLFSLIVTFFTSLYFIFTFGLSLRTLPDEFPDFPEITIADGTLTTNPAKPIEIIEDNTYFALDSTGSITQIPDEYRKGILLSNTEIIVRTDDFPEDRVVTYTELLQSLERDSIYVDKETLIDVIRGFSVVIMVIAPVFILIGQFLGTLFSAFLFSIIGFIILSIMGIQGAFGKSFTIALYASIPVFYVEFLFSTVGDVLNQLGFSVDPGAICCLIPLVFSMLLWGLFWGIGAWGISREPKLPNSN